MPPFSTITPRVHFYLNKKRTLALLFVLMEAVSILLDVLGTNTWNLSMVSFLLSGLGFLMTLYGAFFLERRGLKDRLTTVEVVYSFTQLMVAYVDLVIRILKYNITCNYKASAFSLAFALVVLVYAFKTKETSSTHSEVIRSDPPLEAELIVHGIPKNNNSDAVSMENIDKYKNLTKRYGNVGCRNTTPVSWTKTVSVDCPDDGYKWSKYGQQGILGAKHPRSYYRCEYRHRGCLALKQVQISDEDPTDLKVTYIGPHTCSTH